ncbi:hypothetical protein LTS18_003024 [Coniosporium uncinatum]|uniref:Uncharacterized protein n=1 Tax=Coniosporium uncinatum TaxID=93489 RepID=A0ACC3DY14_9PEZI|nr:hypothetical protein LTS18_003024 [Coniosporium uncinatum]
MTCPPAVWVRAHPQNVEINEARMLAVARPIGRGWLRSGLRRPLLPPPPPPASLLLPPVPRPVTARQLSFQARWGFAVQVGGGINYPADPAPAPAALLRPVPSPALPLSAAVSDDDDDDDDAAPLEPVRGWDWDEEMEDEEMGRERERREDEERREREKERERRDEDWARVRREEGWGTEEEEKDDDEEEMEDALALPRSVAGPVAGAGAAPPPGSQAAFAASQLADVVRRRWDWIPSNSKAPYLPTAVGKWWTLPAGAPALSRDRAAVHGHVGRIMETDLGKRLEQPCEGCQAAGDECWVYTDLAIKHISYASPGCARCMWGKRKCSHGKRTPKVKRVPTSSRPQNLGPKPPGGPPPGAGGLVSV